MKGKILSVAFALAVHTGAGAQQFASVQQPRTVVVPPAGAPVQRGEAAESILDRRITLRLRDAALSTALQDIALAAEVGFVYSREVLPGRTRVSLDAQGMRVSDALDRVLKGTGLMYAATTAGQVTVVPAPVPLKDGRIVGRVIHAETKEPLPDVHISLQGTTRTTLTNVRGEFTLNDVAPGTYVVSARRVGLKGGNERVTVVADTLVRLEFALVPSISRLDEVVVTSTVTETQLRSVPVDVTTITAEQIQARNITNIQQLFRGDIPGIFMEEMGYLDVDPMSGRTPQVRGQNFLSAREQSTSYLKVYLDGFLVPYSVVAQLDPSTIERIEVVRGPAATTMYGSGASDGVMQIFTKRGTFGAKPRIGVDLSTKAFDSPYVKNVVLSPSARVNLSGGGEEFSYQANALYEREGEWVPDYKNDRKALGLNLRWHTGPIELSGNIHYSGPNHYNDPPSPWEALGLFEGRFARAKLSPYNLAPRHTTNSAQVQTTGVKLTYRALPTWSHDLELGNNNNIRRTIRDARVYTDPTDTLLQYTVINQVTTTAKYTTMWVTRLGRGLSSDLVAGIDYEGEDYDYNYITGTRYITGGSLGGTAYPSRTTGRNTGYRATWVFGVNDALYLTAGARGESNPNYGSDVGIVWAPRMGATYVIEAGDAVLKPRVSYGWANRPPDARQKDGRETTSYQSGNAINYTHWLPNPDLLPPESNGVDIGFDMDVGNWLTFKVTRGLSWSDKDILQSVTSDTVPLTPPLFQVHNYNKFVNIGEVQTKSWEASLGVRWREWSFNSTYSQADNIIRSLPPEGIFTSSYSYLKVGDRLDNIPRYFASARLFYSTRRTTANIGFSMKGRYRANDQASAFERTYAVPELFGPGIAGRNITMPRIAKYDLNITQYVLPTTAVYLGIQNLFNERTSEGYDTRSPMAGRVFTMGMRWMSY